MLYFPSLLGWLPTPPFTEFTDAQPQFMQSLTVGVLSLEGRVEKYRLI